MQKEILTTVCFCLAAAIGYADTSTGTERARTNVRNSGQGGREAEASLPSDLTLQQILELANEINAKATNESYEEKSDTTEDEIDNNILISHELTLQQILELIERLSGKPVIRDSKLGNITISLSTKKGVSDHEMLRILESALSINNVALIELGDGLLKAVDAKSVSAQSPAFIERSLLNDVPSEKICAKMFKLEHISAEDFSQLISKLLTPVSSSCIVFKDSNSLLITDSVSNLQRVELIIKKVDVPEHTKISSRIFRIKHGDAGEITNLLNKVISGQKEEKKDEAVTASKSSRTENSEKISGVDVSTFRFSKNITIEFDKRSNSVVACGTEKDIELVESIINKIDVLLDQVRIEVIITEVALNKNQKTGLDTFGISHNMNGSGGIPNSEGHEISFTSGGSSGIEAVIGSLKKFDIGAVFNVAKSNSNVKILSAPTIVTTHNREAIIKTGHSVPVVKSDISNTSSAGKDGVSMKSTVEYKDIGMELKVKPLIGVNGIVQLEIFQKTERKGNTVKINGNEMPSTLKREATSFVSVNDGDVVVLAGLQDKQTDKLKSKMWLLGDIPLIGDVLFSPKSKTEITTELVIFIKPTIIANPSEQASFASEVVKDSPVKEEIDSYNMVGKFLPPPAFPQFTFADPTDDFNRRNYGKKRSKIKQSNDLPHKNRHESKYWRRRTRGYDEDVLWSPGYGDRRFDQFDRYYDDRPGNRYSSRFR